MRVVRGFVFVLALVATAQALASTNAGEDSCVLATSGQTLSFTQFLSQAGTFARQNRRCVDLVSNGKLLGIQIDRLGIPQDDESPILHECLQLSCDETN